MWKIQRVPKVQEVEVRLGEFLVCHARIMLKVLVRIYLVKSGSHQSACCTRQKRDANSEKSALSHTVGLKNIPVKGLQRMATNVQWLFWRRHDIWVVFHNVEPPRSSSILRKSLTMRKPIWKIFKTGCFMWKHRSGRFGETFKGLIIPFGSLVECHPISTKDQSRNDQLWKKVLPGIFLGYVVYARRIWKGDRLFVDLQELEERDASDIHARRLKSKEVILPKSGE